ncbi:hypothetical protein BDV93DRAFT_511509 [Ceratobasidium sp. AG-I]|nr:hypothetical protein BDV93DRAFT_511509 [Ceratobasidium sp. AG-I]
MTTYLLNLSNQPEDEVNWLQELEAWKQRTKSHIEWEEWQVGGGWQVKIKINGKDYHDILGAGNRKQDAKEDAAIQLEAAAQFDLDQVSLFLNKVYAKVVSGVGYCLILVTVFIRRHGVASSWRACVMYYPAALIPEGVSGHA